MWDTASLRCVRTLSGHTADVLALSASQNFLYSSSVDCTVRVWDRRRLVCIQTLGDNTLPRTLALRATSRFVAAARGQSVQIWDAASTADFNAMPRNDVRACALED